jgi:hypothetical protein
VNTLVLVLALASQTASPAVSPEVTPAVDAQGRAVTIIDVDADVIYGDLHKPDHDIVRTPRPHKFKSLIENRKDFRAKVLATGSHI